MRKLIVTVVIAVALNTSPVAFAGAIDDAVRAQKVRDIAREYGVYGARVGIDDTLAFHSRIEASPALQEAFREIQERDDRILVFLEYSGSAAQATSEGYIQINVTESDSAIVNALRGTQSACTDCN